jgi:hypothetical protein
MDIVTRCAECLNQGLINWAMQNEPRDFSLGAAYAAGVDVANGKSYIFNACIAALIACVVFGLGGSISTMSALTLGACSYFGRRVADESFNVMLPNLVRYFAPNVLKPNPWLSFGDVVIFYDIMPRNPLG